VIHRVSSRADAFIRRLATVAVLATASAAFSGVAQSQALYFQERVINQAAPDGSRTPPDISLSKIEAYQNWVGNASMQDVLYPEVPQNSLYPCVPSTSPVGERCGNDVLTQSQPGWVFADPIDPDPNVPRRYVQFASLVKNVVDNGDPEPFHDEKVYVRKSMDGGHTFDSGTLFTPLRIQGRENNDFEPLNGMRVNTNGARVPGTAFIGKSFDDAILAPITITDPSFTNVTSYSDAYVLRGTWSGGDLTWTQSATAHVPATYSTRGADEPTVLALDATRCIMVVRGSNEYRYPNSDVYWNANIAGHYWLFQSNDGCRTWTSGPTRWGYSDGTPFFAPAANSTLYRLPGSNRVYWMGAISASNSEGNWPRTTLITAEVDTQNLGIIKDTVTIMDRMGPGDTDRVQLNNMQMAMQEHGAFVYWPREDFGHVGCPNDLTYDKPFSWIQVAATTGNNAQLAVTPTANLSHQLTWASSASDVVQWHVRRRYLSGNPLTDLWEVVGVPLPATSTGATISGYEAWNEAEYEVVAERPNGVAEVSNRILVRFPQWQGPRLSFSFPTEAAAGDAAPRGSVYISWSYNPVGTLSGFRLYRRYLTASGPEPWHVVGDATADRRGVTLSGYNETDQFELRIQALDTAGALDSNVVSVRFPTQCIRQPY
jgi:hypothetical protein